MDHTRLASHRETVLFLECASVFSELPEEHVEFLAGLSARVHLPAGEALFEEGDPGDAVFVIRRGKVEVFTHLPNGDELILAQLGEYELIGEHYLFDGTGGRRSASVRASHATDLIRISHDTFDRLLKRNPTIAKQLAWRRMQREQENLARRSELFRIIRNLPAQTPTVRMQFQQGEVLFREGDEPDGVYLVTRGVACVYRESAPEGVLSEVTVGQCFGERAVVSATPRSASVRAKGELDVLRIPKENFVRLHEQSADLRDVVCGLEFSYQLPTRGLALQYTCRREDEDSIERLYRLPDQREFLSSFLVRRRVFRMERLGLGRGPHQVEHAWRDDAAGLERSLRLGPSGEVVGMVAAGPWDQMPQMIEAALDASPLSADSVEAFKRTGNLPLEALREQDAGDPDAIACFCLNVPARRIHELVKAGYASFEALRKTTGCGSVCGGCESTICDLVKPPDWIPVSVRSMPINDALRTFTLQPERAYPAWAAGQHILVEGRIRGVWVRRPYLISAASGAGAPQIIVQRQAKGDFTPWLFDGPAHEKQLRISAPRGNVVRQENHRKRVCLAHDIGLAHSLAIVRSAIAIRSSAPVHVVCFTSDSVFAPLVRELKDAARTHSNITVQSFEGAAKIRVDRALVLALKSGFADADYYLCGSADSVARLRNLAEQVGVPEECLNVEALSSVAPPNTSAADGMTKLKRLALLGLLLAGLIAAALLF